VEEGPAVLKLQNVVPIFAFGVVRKLDFIGDGEKPKRKPIFLVNGVPRVAGSIKLMHFLVMAIKAWEIMLERYAGWIRFFGGGEGWYY
jgi:hypothetical protein